MAHILGHDRLQMLLLSETVDDDVDPDHPVRFIDTFVDGLDLQAAGFARVEPRATGRPGYAPVDLLKLSIYGLPQPGALQPSARGGGGPHPRGDVATAVGAGEYGLKRHCQIINVRSFEPSSFPLLLAGDNLVLDGVVDVLR